MCNNKKLRTVLNSLTLFRKGYLFKKAKKVRQQNNNFGSKVNAQSSKIQEIQFIEQLYNNIRLQYICTFSLRLLLLWL